MMIEPWSDERHLVVRGRHLVMMSDNRLVVCDGGIGFCECHHRLMAQAHEPKHHGKRRAQQAVSSSEPSHDHDDKNGRGP
jgi:hypothetical protein